MGKRVPYKKATSRGGLEGLPLETNAIPGSYDKHTKPVKPLSR